MPQANAFSSSTVQLFLISLEAMTIVLCIIVELNHTLRPASFHAFLSRSPMSSSGQSVFDVKR